jgi:hypothetical protein
VGLARPGGSLSSQPHAIPSPAIRHRPGEDIDHVLAA